MIQDYVFIFTSFLIGITFGYIPAYIKEKGKIRALLENVSELENAKNSIQSKYLKEIEEVKKENSLELERRKYKYQEKKEQFAKYFSLIDACHEEWNKKGFIKVMELFGELMRRYDSDGEAALAAFSAGISELYKDANIGYLKLRTETHSLRLVSTDEMDEILDSLESSLKEAIDISDEFMKKVASNFGMLEQYEVDEYMGKSANLGNSIAAKRYELRRSMKLELEKI